MANLVRRPRSGNDWTKLELKGWNISVEEQDTAAFFGIPELPPPNVDPEFLMVEKPEDMVSDFNAELLHLLKLTQREPGYRPGGDSASGDFTIALLRYLGYVKRQRVNRSRKELGLLVSCQNLSAQPDICLFDSETEKILLLVHLDKSYKENYEGDPIPQLIAEAIAAFDYNNYDRHVHSGQHVEPQIVPGIIIDHTTPMFFKIRVTDELTKHVRHGTYPPEPTVVYKYRPRLPRPFRSTWDGIQPLDNRAIILSCFEAFKAVIGI